MGTDVEEFVMEAMALANNHILTKHWAKAEPIVSLLRRTCPDDPLARALYGRWFEVSRGGYDDGQADIFGEPWRGEDLRGRSIEVFADQGMGDLINLLRYLRVLKEKYDCRIVLNCYAFYEQFKRIMEQQSYVDVFTNKHVKCDFQTNLMSVPHFLHGAEQIIYPTAFGLLNATKIPPQDQLVRTEGWPIGNNRAYECHVGVCWRSNPDNELFALKSMPPIMLEHYNTGDETFHSLLPDSSDAPSWMQRHELTDLWDTARLMQSVDAVISVDTATLHLAGALGIPAIGLIAAEGDVRWEEGRDVPSRWYPSVRIIRCSASDGGSWSSAVMESTQVLSWMLHGD